MDSDKNSHNKSLLSAAKEQEKVVLRRKCLESNNSSEGAQLERRRQVRAGEVGVPVSEAEATGTDEMAGVKRGMEDEGRRQKWGNVYSIISL